MLTKLTTGDMLEYTYIQENSQTQFVIHNLLNLPIKKAIHIILSQKEKKSCSFETHSGYCWSLGKTNKFDPCITPIGVELNDFFSESSLYTLIPYVPFILHHFFYKPIPDDFLTEN